MMDVGRIVCAGCGGPLTVRRGQKVILPSTRMTFDEERVVVQETRTDAWCGDCVEKWDKAMGKN